MRNIIILIVAMLNIIQSQAQIPSSCSSPLVLQTAYDADVKHLALQRIFANTVPVDTILIKYRDSITVPQFVQEPIWEGLSAIFNLTAVPERDSVFDKYCIHQQVSYVYHSIYVGVDTSYSWTHQWQNLNTTTGITSLDNLLSTYGFTVTYFSSFGGNYARLTTNQNINVLPLCDSIETFNGVLYSEPDFYAGDGDEITYIVSGSDRLYYFTLGLGDCYSGCTEFHTYKFRVFQDCSVEYIGTFSTATYFPPLLNCNITSGIDDVKSGRFFIYPNPVKDYLYIETNYMNEVNFEILNIYGQILKTGVFTEKSKIALNTITAGIYFLKLFNKANRNQLCYKLIKA